MSTYREFANFRGWLQKIIKASTRKPRSTGFDGADLRRIRAKKGVGQPPVVGEWNNWPRAAQADKRCNPPHISQRLRWVFLPPASDLDHYAHVILGTSWVFLPPASDLDHYAHVILGTSWLRKSRGRA